MYGGSAKRHGDFPVGLLNLRAFEPFNLENDIKDGIISNEGMMKISRENKEKESDESEDAWYETIKED